MGTLFEQNPRRNFSVTKKDVVDQIKLIKQISSNSKLTFEEVLRVLKILSIKDKTIFL